MFDAEKVKPISSLIGLNREPSNEEMQAAAGVALEMVCALVNSAVKLANAFDEMLKGDDNEPA